MMIYSKHQHIPRPNANASSSQSGNVFFFIMLGLVLFAALSYAVVGGSTTTPTSVLEEENAKITTAQIASYTADMRAGIMQLQLDGCSNIDYTPPADQTTGDKSCHLFNAAGAAVAYKDLNLGSGCPLTDLEIGAVCNGVVFAGEVGGNRIYTTTNDLGVYSWNNGTDDPPWSACNATSTSDGAANTDALVDCVHINAEANAPYKAASSCRALGAEWYVPARIELELLYTNRIAIGGFNLSGAYWSSWRLDFPHGWGLNFDGTGGAPYTKNTSLNVRCTRRG